VFRRPKRSRNEVVAPKEEEEEEIYVWSKSFTQKVGAAFLKIPIITHIYLYSTRKNLTSSSTYTNIKILFSNCFVQQQLMHSLKQVQKHVDF
jgi:hypothetical protein